MTDCQSVVTAYRDLRDNLTSLADKASDRMRAITLRQRALVAGDLAEQCNDIFAGGDVPHGAKALQEAQQATQLASAATGANSAEIDRVAAVAAEANTTLNGVVESGPRRSTFTGRFRGSLRVSPPNNKVTIDGGLRDVANDGVGALSENAPPSVDRATAWRHRLGLGSAAMEGTAESSEAAAPSARIAMARENMRRIVQDRLGGDPVLLAAVDDLAISGAEAVALLEQQGPPPQPAHFGALEAIVAFDGSRPSFLLKEDQIDFESSYDTDRWEVQLGPRLDDLRDFAACVGRVETGNIHIGTAFLVAPTLAITNRHVAQSIADVGIDPPDLFAPAFLDFGREQRPGRVSHDRREIQRVLFVGADEIVEGAPLDHRRLDLALIEVSPSSLVGAAGVRYLQLSSRAGDLPSNWLVAAVGYPAGWRDYVPSALLTEYETVLRRLLDGDAGTKRFAPGRTSGMVDATPRWSAMHDATTINGNSGSPMAHMRQGALKVTGLHYGGRWGGERTNWAHVLANCGDGQCFPGQLSLRDALGRHGVTL